MSWYACRIFSSRFFLLQFWFCTLISLSLSLSLSLSVYFVSSCLYEKGIVNLERECCGEREDFMALVEQGMNEEGSSTGMLYMEVIRWNIEDGKLCLEVP